MEDDWPPRKTSTYERPFTQEGNYLVDYVMYNCWEIGANKNASNIYMCFMATSIFVLCNGVDIFAK